MLVIVVATLICWFVWWITRNFSDDIIKRIVSQIYSGKGLELDEFLIEIPKNRSGNQYESISINDAIASELMKVRRDLVKLRVQQEKKDWSSYPESFLELWFIYRDYPYSAICESYKSQKNKKEYGRIIILLDYFPEKFLLFRGDELNGEIIRNINSPKKNIIARGMTLPVYIYDPETDTESYETEEARILSIIKLEDSEDDNIILTLEIDISYPESIHKNIIVRKIELSDINEYCDFVIDEN